MLLHLFSENIPSVLIKESASKLQLDNIPLLDNPAEQQGRAISEIDQEMMESVLKLLNISIFRVHIIYQLYTVSAPLLTIVIAGDHLLSAAYMRNGVRFCEIMNPKDIYSLLGQAFSQFPICEQEQHEVFEITGVTDILETIDKPERVIISPMNNIVQNTLQNSINSNPRMLCVLDDGKGRKIHYLVIDNHKDAFSILEREESNMLLFIGSLRPVVEGIFSSFFYRLKTMTEIVMTAEPINAE